FRVVLVDQLLHLDPRHPRGEVTDRLTEVAQGSERGLGRVEIADADDEEYRGVLPVVLLGELLDRGYGREQGEAADLLGGVLREVAEPRDELNGTVVGVPREHHGRL